jgi:hypothetical protein
MIVPVVEASVEVGGSLAQIDAAEGGEKFRSYESPGC